MDQLERRVQPSVTLFESDWDCDEAAAKGFIGTSDFSSSSSCSVLGDELVSSESTEATDGEDDYIAELTRQMTHYMLQDDHDKTSISSQKNQELLGSAGWPQCSSLWSPLGSNHGSPEGPSLEPTPPATPVKNSCSYADVLRKLDKLGTANEGSRKPHGISTSTTQVAENPSVGFGSNQGLASDQTQDFQNLEAYYRLKQEQISKKQGSSANRGRQSKIGNHQFEPNNYQHQNKGESWGGSANGTRSGSPTQFGSPASNPWMNPQPRSGMRAVFLSSSGTKTGPSCGTGVFLPCVIGNTSQSPKKRGCSPVLIPAKVVQALKVHFDRIGDLPRPNATSSPMQNDALKGGRASMQSTKKRHSRAVQPEMNHNNEMGLPQEWTY